MDQKSSHIGDWNSCLPCLYLTLTHLWVRGLDLEKWGYREIEPRQSFTPGENPQNQLEHKGAQRRSKKTMYWHRQHFHQPLPVPVVVAWSYARVTWIKTNQTNAVLVFALFNAVLLKEVSKLEPIPACLQTICIYYELSSLTKYLRASDTFVHLVGALLHFWLASYLLGLLRSCD